MDRNCLQYQQRMSQLPNLLHTLLLLVSLTTAPVANGLIAKMKIVDPAATTQGEVDCSKYMYFLFLAIVTITSAKPVHLPPY